MKSRSKVFLQELPKNKNVMWKSAVKAGYGITYSKHNTKAIMRTALKEGAKDLMEQVSNKSISKENAKQLMCELLGLSPQAVFDEMRKIATNNKDYSSALKVLAPLSKELGVDIGSQDQQNITVPVLNIGVVKNENGNDVKDVV